jgi:hypothetical protein
MRPLPSPFRAAGNGGLGVCLNLCLNLLSLRAPRSNSLADAFTLNNPTPNACGREAEFLLAASLGLRCKCEARDTIANCVWVTPYAAARSRSSHSGEQQTLLQSGDDGDTRQSAGHAEESVLAGPMQPLSELWLAFKTIRSTMPAIGLPKTAVALRCDAVLRRDRLGLRAAAPQLLQRADNALRHEDDAQDEQDAVDGIGRADEVRPEPHAQALRQQ